MSDPQPFLVGTYTDLDALAHQPYAPTPGVGIYTVHLNDDGNMDTVSTTPITNPAVLIPHPDGRSMYAIVETIIANGEVVQFELQPGGELSRMGSIEATGRSTCYLATAPQRDAAVIINYWDAIIDVAAMAPDGALGPIEQSFQQVARADGEWRQVANREDHWGNRQVGPHAHCAHFFHDWVFIPDLGENAIFQYRWDDDAHTLNRETHIEFEAGSGPRHMAMHPRLDICYVSNELFNTVATCTLDSSDPDVVKQRLSPVQYTSTLDNREQTSYVSEIKLSDDARFLYVSNRGDNSIAIFSVGDDGILERLGIVPTGGKFPRHFAISPDGRSLVVANQDSGQIRLFDRDPESGALTATETTLDIPAPNYIRFVPADPGS